MEEIIEQVSNEQASALEIFIKENMKFIHPKLYKKIVLCKSQRMIEDRLEIRWWIEIGDPHKEGGDAQ